MYTILDCYTDEPAGLGVPPYIGTYPRYIAGKLISENKKYNYITIDDLRYMHLKKKNKSLKTDIKTYNRTGNVNKILNKTKTLIVICGVHVPGKYLSALPGTLHEVSKLIKDIHNARKILAGPAATEFGTRLEGGKKAEKTDISIFDDIMQTESYKKIAKYATIGADIVKKIQWETIAEIETSRGCRRKTGCSFCTEPLKHRLEFREVKDILAEAKELRKNNVMHFRLGKQSDFFSWSAKDIEKILKGISKLDVKTLHIDNVDPVSVTEEKVKLVVKYCTPGNVAALGIESFDEIVVKENNLNSTPEKSMEAIRIINKYGKSIGENGMPKFLPGINILFGLKGESKKTHEKNMQYLMQILDEELLVRRINIRQVAAFPGTKLYDDCGNKFVKKNKKYYWKWRNEIRQKIDNTMLKKLVPVSSVLKQVRMEVHDGNTTFGRQFGTYPLVVGVKQRLELGKYHDIKVVGHMLRSVVGEIIK